MHEEKHRQNEFDGGTHALRRLGLSTYKRDYGTRRCIYLSDLVGDDPRGPVRALDVLVGIGGVGEGFRLRVETELAIADTTGDVGHVAQER